MSGAVTTVDLEIQTGQSAVGHMLDASSKVSRRRRAVWPSLEWLAYFRSNARDDEGDASIPWDEGVTLTDVQRDAIATSVQEFQLGESGEGAHLLRCARTHASDTGDPDYLAAARLFVAEEQRHGRDLGRVLDLAGIPRVAHAWPDAVFRWLRHRAGLELSIAVLVTAEIIAKVYYAALQHATPSRVLHALCERILRDEHWHVRFQCERLAILRRRRRSVGLTATHGLHWFLMSGTCLVVWHKHGRTMRAGGYGFFTFLRRSFAELATAVRIMDPRRYEFGPSDSATEVRR